MMLSNEICAAMRPKTLREGHSRCHLVLNKTVYWASATAGLAHICAEYKLIEYMKCAPTWIDNIGSGYDNSSSVVATVMRYPSGSARPGWLFNNLSMCAESQRDIVW